VTIATAIATADTSALFLARNTAFAINVKILACFEPALPARPLIDAAPNAQY
jgi:hypothetical protein